MSSRVLKALNCATEDEAVALLSKFNSFLCDVRVATGTRDMQSALAAVWSLAGKKAPAANNSDQPTDSEKAVMKATGKTLAEIREANREWDALAAESGDQNSVRVGKSAK